MSSNPNQADDRTQYGGQAVVEGVMMRSPRYFAVACRRRSNNEIVLKVEDVEAKMRKFEWLNKPFLRGSLALIDSLAMGMKALLYAANIQAADEAAVGNLQAQVTSVEAAVESAEAQPINGIVIGFTLVAALVFGYTIFWILPELITGAIQALMHVHHLTWSQSLYANLFEGLLRICFFLAYIIAISRLAHVHRVFQYHGA
jgi:uncharacterized protein YqhQ